MSPRPPPSQSPSAKSHHHLPQPVFVKDCMPHTLPSSSHQNMETFLNFGGGVNPMAYKGYTFSKQGRFQFWHNQSPHPQSMPSLQSHQPNTPQPSREIASHLPLRKQSNDPPLSSPNSCSTFLGPPTPFLCKLSVKHLAYSSLLSPNIYLSWRAFQLSYFLAAICVTAIDNLVFIATLPGIAFLYSLLSNSVILGTTVQYRKNHHDNDSADESSKLHGLVAIIFQGGSHACFIAGIGTLLTVLYGGNDAAQIAASYLQSSIVYLIVVGATLHLIDICLTPVPFRLLSTVPLYTVMFLYFVVWLRGGTIDQILIGSAIMFGSCFVACILLHLFARTIFVFVHRNAMGETVLPGQIADQGGQA